MIYFLLLTNQPNVATLMIIHFTVGVMMQTLSLMKQDFSKLFKWFYENFMIFNPDKCLFLTLGFQYAQPNFSYDNITIKNLSEEKILSITIDNKLTFKSHLKNIWKKANRKLNALVRITKLTSLFQRKNFVEFLHKVSIFILPSSLNVYI